MYFQVKRQNDLMFTIPNLDSGALESVDEEIKHGSNVYLIDLDDSESPKIARVFSVDYNSRVVTLSVNGIPKAATFVLPSVVEKTKRKFELSVMGTFVYDLDFEVSWDTFVRDYAHASVDDWSGVLLNVKQVLVDKYNNGLND